MTARHAKRGTRRNRTQQNKQHRSRAGWRFERIHSGGLSVNAGLRPIRSASIKGSLFEPDNAQFCRNPNCVKAIHLNWHKGLHMGTRSNKAPRSKEGRNRQNKPQRSRAAWVWELITNKILGLFVGLVLDGAVRWLKSDQAKQLLDAVVQWFRKSLDDWMM
jgi:hypothetical protein